MRIPLWDLQIPKEKKKKKILSHRAFLEELLVTVCMGRARLQSSALSWVKLGGKTGKKTPKNHLAQSFASSFSESSKELPWEGAKKNSGMNAQGQNPFASQATNHRLEFDGKLGLRFWELLLF